MTEGRDGGQATPAGSTGSPPSFRSGELSDPKLTAALRTLELTVRRRLDGVLHGDHLGLIPGPGSEPGDAREYQPGDDVRQMDWSVTARTTHPHVRQSVADRELETWLVIDLSASLDFGTAGCEKRDLVVASAAAITHLTSSGGNRVGAIISTGAQTTRIPARGGRIHAQAMLRKIATTPHAPDGVRGDLVGAIEALRRPQRRRGLAVVISDFLGPIDWERSLRAISGRHDVLGVEVVDPRDLELPDVGDVVLHDPESGRTREFTTTPQLRADFARVAAEHRVEVRQALRRCGAPLMSLHTDRDWIADVVRFISARRHSYGAGAGTGGVRS
ncbi:DUF58 domain-containing protein [Rhodococcus erythropolis]|uniref:DUF58 domain-containing protein n=1 Tax=Rhodococcus erythropolis TaxID=1833 RepID=UPI001BACD76F|nr:DUF58 domain-containing protein [Rhodococcus erythropolis]MBS2987828.1 DUF58 domain-containing protein [Rhodococcus erythropolis]